MCSELTTGLCRTCVVSNFFMLKLTEYREPSVGHLCAFRLNNKHCLEVSVVINCCVSFEMHIGSIMDI